ncbi:MAG TPA: hypothetical protein VHD15_10955 [Hyphomicrobiales bacterium]|nr:hypothetical protein [Hyphomicrobiales bacterium]
MTNGNPIEAFQNALDRRGPAVELWPDGQRAAAATLLVTSPEARRRHGEAERLQALLGAVLETAPIRPGALGRILAGIDARRGAGRMIDPLRALMRPRAAFVLTVIAAGMFALGALRGADIAASLGGDDGDSYAMLSSSDSLPAIFEGE